METIKEKEEEIEQENSGLKEWTEEDDDKIGNICDPYYELWKSSGRGILRGGWCHDIAKMAKSLFIFFFFSFLLIRKSVDTQDGTTKERCMGVYK